MPHTPNATLGTRQHMCISGLFRSPGSTRCIHESLLLPKAYAAGEGCRRSCPCQVDVAPRKRVLPRPAPLPPQQHMSHPQSQSPQPRLSSLSCVTSGVCLTFRNPTRTGTWPPLPLPQPPQSCLSCMCVATSGGCVSGPWESLMHWRTAAATFS